MPPSFYRKQRRGVAAVESAILLSFLFFVFIATIDFCRVFYFSQIVSNCARNGAVYGSADAIQALDANGIQAAAEADARNLNLELLQVSSSTNYSDNPTYVVVTVTYPFKTIIQYPGIPKQTTLHRAVRMSVVPDRPTFH